VGQARNARGLVRILGLAFGLAVVFGGTVGVGILRLPGEIAGRLNSVSLILLVWVVGALYTVLGAVSLSELGAALPQAGGFYVYSRRAFGPAAGFVMGWADWMSNCISIAYAAVAAAEYLLALMPAAYVKFAWAATAIALGLLAGFAALQWFGLRLSSTVQKVTSSVTAVTFLVLAGACLLHHKAAYGAASAGAAAPVAHGGLRALIAVMPAIVVAYDGWYEAIYFTEEDRDPARHLPRAMIGGVGLILTLYLVMNVAFLHVLPLEVLGASKLAAADAARVVFPAWSGTFVTVLSLLTLLGLMHALLLGAPRILFALGRDGLFRGAWRVDAAGTPRVGLMATAAMTAVLIATGKFDQIIGVAAVVVAASYGVNYLAVFVLRVREPELQRPFRAWGYPVSTGLVLVGSVAFLMLDLRADRESAWRALVLLALAGPVYWYMRRSAGARMAG
jgi:APA family basic amino acid/polyamine antiporter